MTIQDIITLVCGIGWIGTFIIFFIQRNDTKKDKNDEVKKELDLIKQDIGLMRKDLKKNEKDVVRIQLLYLMLNYTPKDEKELLTCAEHYFSKEHLHANWYMTPMFNRFIEEKGIAKPSWFEGD